MAKRKDRPETQSELGDDDARFWLREIEAAKCRNATWYDNADRAEKRYRDEEERASGSLNIFWANVETQKAAIGEDFGKPEVTRVNAPENDGGLARHVALVWERAIAAAVRDDDDNHDIGLAVGDVFVPGRGVIWCELDLDEDEAGRVRWARAPLVRIPYRDFLHGEATRWGSVPWVARAHEWTRDDLVANCRLTEAEAEQVPLCVDRTAAQLEGETLTKQQRDQFKRARVWEIWTTFPRKRRLYVAEGYADRVLLGQDDPYRLKGFFPCPRPMQANGDEARPPLTDLSRYDDQAAELDRVCERIFVLTDVLRNRGAYNARFKQLPDLMNSGDNVFLPFEEWSELQANGGIEAAMQALPLEAISVVLDRLGMQRQTLISLIYELSGISDLARGQTDPNETLGAQKLKKSFGSGRFRARETESRRLAAEGYTIKGEVIAEHFPRLQLQEMSGIPLPTQDEIDAARAELGAIQAEQQAIAQRAQMMAQQAQAEGRQAPPMPQAPQPDPKRMRQLQRIAGAQWSWEEIEAVLTSDYRRCYACEVETDQSKFVDETADQQNRTQFFQMVMQALEQVAPMIQGNPKVGEIFKALVLFVISSFKAGRSQEEGIERVIDEAIQKAMEAAGQPQQEDPRIAAEKATADARVQVAQTQLQTAQVKLQTEQIRAQNDKADELTKQQTAQVQTQEKAAQAQIKTAESAQKVEAQQDLNQAKRVGHAIDLANKQEKAAFEAQTRATAEQALLKGPTRAPGSKGRAA